MTTTSQFLRVLAAERENLVSVYISLPSDAQSALERRLSDAFTSDSFDESAKAWNEERSRVVHEVFQQHLLPMGAKWAREYLRDEVEDFIATSCAAILKKVIRLFPVLYIVLTIFRDAMLLPTSANSRNSEKLPLSWRYPGGKAIRNGMTFALFSSMNMAACESIPRSPTCTTPR